MLEVPDLGLASWSWIYIITGLWYPNALNFDSLYWFWRCREYPCPYSPDFGLWRHWRFLTGVWHLDLNMVTGVYYNHALSWFLRCKDHPRPSSPDLGLCRMLEVPYWGLASWSWFGYGQWSLIYPWSKCWLSILILKVQRTSMSFKSSFGALQDAGGSWLKFCILILILIWSLVFDTPLCVL